MVVGTSTEGVGIGGLIMSGFDGGGASTTTGHVVFTGGAMRCGGSLSWVSMMRVFGRNDIGWGAMRGVIWFGLDCVYIDTHSSYASNWSSLTRRNFGNLVPPIPYSAWVIAQASTHLIVNPRVQHSRTKPSHAQSSDRRY